MVAARKPAQAPKLPPHTIGVARVTSKGQITVPKAVRDHFGLRPGDEIKFVEDDHGLRVLQHFKENPFEKWRGYLKHLTAGTPVFLWPLMIPIEILGTIIKPVALALRLFANMTAGHILVAVLFMFAVQGLGFLAEATVGKLVLGGVISGMSLVAAVAIYFLELFVAFLQAFVFMFLTTVFISQLSHHDEHEHHDAPDHEHAHA